MIVQAFVIAYFAFWTYEEYVNNAYFQSYVNASLQGSSFAIIAISSVGIFTAIASGLYMKLRRTRRELEGLVSTETPSASSVSSGSVLAPHVEQHLIDMIRKSAPPDSSNSAAMPSLRREDQTGAGSG